MIETTNEAPRTRPCECLEIEIAYVIQNIVVVPRYTSDYKEFVIMQNGSVPSSSFWNWPMYRRLGPMSCLEIEYNQVGQVSAVLVLAAEDQKFVALIEGCSVA